MHSKTIKWVFTITAFILFFSSCRTEFEQIRTSNDTAKVLAAANNYYNEGDYYKAQTLYELIVPIYRGRAEAEDLFYNYAMTHYNQGHFDTASHYFKTFANTYTGSSRREEADYLSALCLYKLSPIYTLDQTPSKDAIVAFEYFANLYPLSERITEVNNKIDELRAKMEQKAFHHGMLYYKMDDYSSTIRSFKNMLKEYPESAKAEEVRFLITQASFEMAMNSIYEKKQERMEEAIEYSEKFLRKYPNSEKKDKVVKLQEKTKTELNNLNNG